MDTRIPPMLVVFAAAVAAPLVGELTRRFGLAVVVLELLLGVAIGPHGLGWAAPVGGVPYFAILGMAFLFFIAGLEIDLEAIGAKPLSLAIIGWLVVFLLAGAAAAGLHAAGLVHSWGVVAIALATTTLGVLVPIMRDSATLGTPFGRSVMALGAVGELGPILAMSLALSRRHTVPAQTAFTLAFLAIVIAVAWLLVQGGSVPRILGLLRRTMTQSSQLPVRTILLLVGALALLAESLGLDLVLGALAAGMIIALATRGLDKQVLHHKVDALGFGFLVPVFFITSGMRLEVGAIFASGAGLALTAAFFAALLAVRLPLYLLYLRMFGGRQSAALTLYSATTLSLVVALTQVAVENHLMQATEAAPLVGGAMLTVIFFPPIALRLTGHSVREAMASARHRDGL